MRWLRSALFNLAFFGWTVLFGLAFVWMLLGTARAAFAYLRIWAATIAWLLARLVGLEMEVRGRDNLPSGPAIIASKHQSAWETVMFFLVLREPAFVLKRELTHVPLYGWYARKTGAIAVDRTAGARAVKRLVEAARRALAAGRSVVIFPEGTRAAPGRRLPYNPGVAALYTQLDAPVVPTALNSGLFWGRRSFMKRPGKIVVQFLPPMPRGLDKRRFMAELERRIEEGATALAAEAA
ncbi:MAG: lysophospholipid acyltransferase family protein [Alphaproteobacteria bacterium]